MNEDDCPDDAIRDLCWRAAHGFPLASWDVPEGRIVRWLPKLPG